MSTKPWLKSYDRSVPITLKPYPDRTLVDVLIDSSRHKPNYPAISFEGTTLSYRDWQQQSDALAAALVANGVAPGDRVAIVLPNCPQYLIAQFGAWKAGALVTPLNPFYTEAELAHALAATGAEVAVVLTPFYAKLKSIQPQTTLRLLIATNIKEYLPWPKQFLFSWARERREGHRIALQPGDVWLQALLQAFEGVSAEYIPKPHDHALLMFTGGTTGKPKAAISTHHGLLMTGMQLVAWMGNLAEPWHDTTLLYMPLFHTYGNAGVLSAALIAHTTLLPVADPRDIDGLIKTIQRRRPQYLTAVPTVFIALLTHPKVQAGKVDFTSIKLCLSGAAALLQDTKEKFEALTDGRIVEGYGLTESVMAAVLTPVLGTYKPGSVGIPLPDVELRIVDAATGVDVTTMGQVGEVWMRAPQLMVGYWNDAEATEAILHNGWLHTGDVGFLDEDGYLTLVDRQKDVIKPSGFQVWPREVEEVLLTHPAVQEVGVTGVPDPVQGEAVKAWVVLEEGDGVSAEELRTFCKQTLAAYKVPRYFAFVDSLPKSTIGKVLRRELAAHDVE
ncbi:MAG: AMP-binding protein [Anaerolineae bacterium]|nr:AMP-binding protein [Anaerolineae bacterium]